MRRILTGLVAMAGFAAAFAAEVRLPPYTREELPNGVVVYMMRKPNVPLVSFRLILRGGVESEPPELSGLSGITAQLLRRGTGRRTADQFSSELDGLGGTFSAAASDQATIVAAEFLRKDFAAGLDMTADALLHPVFPEDETKKILARSMDGSRSSKDNPQAAIGQYFRAFFYGPSHPYGRPPDEGSYARMTRAAITDYAHRMYTGGNLIVLVGGDFDPAVALPAVKAVFGAMPAGERYEWLKDARPLPGGRLLLVDKPDATQTYFRIAQPGISRTDPDRTAVQVVNTLFGGRFTSMLNDALRVNSGLTYGAGSSVDLNREPGAITISTYTRTDTTEKAMDMALDVMKRLTTTGITAEQLSSVKAYMKGLYPTSQLETADQIENVLGDIELFGLNRGEVDDLFSRIDGVSMERANAAAKKWFGQEQLTFVVLGNAAQIRGVVKKYAGTMKEVSVKEAGFGAR